VYKGSEEKVKAKRAGRTRASSSEDMKKKKSGKKQQADKTGYQW